MNVLPTSIDARRRSVDEDPEEAQWRALMSGDDGDANGASLSLLLRATICRARGPR